MSATIKARAWERERRSALRDKKNGRQKMVGYITDALASKQMQCDDFSLKEAFIGLVDDGRLVHEELGEPEFTHEAAVNTALFSTITKAVLAQRVMDAFTIEDFVLARLVPTERAALQAEIVPGVTPIGDNSEVVAEADQYPTVNFNEDWQRMPIAYKRGMVIPITREAIFFDRTNLVLRTAATIGEWLGVRREKEIADTIIDNPRGSSTGGMGNRMEWRGTQYPTYDTGTNWDNSLSNELVNYSDIENAEKKFDAMLEPYTSEPVVMGNQRTLLCMPAKRYTAMALSDATELRDGTDPVTIRRNPYTGLAIVSSRILYRRVVNGGNAGVAVSTSNSEKYWYWGDFSKGFGWREHWPLTVTQQGSGSYWDFTADIVTAYKASYFGTAYTNQPRAVVRSIN